MKSLFILFLFIFTSILFSFSQDTIGKSNRLVVPYYQPNVANDSNKLDELYRHRYKYRHKIYSEKETYAILNQSGNDKIIGLTAQLEKARKRERIAYVGIPAGIGAMAFEEASISKVYNRNGTTDQRKKSNFETGAAACLVVAIACPTISIVLHQKHKKYRTQAVKLFNARY